MAKKKERGAGRPSLPDEERKERRTIRMSQNVYNWLTKYHESPQRFFDKMVFEKGWVGCLRGKEK